MDSFSSVKSYIFVLLFCSYLHEYLLKYGFCKKYFHWNEPLTSWTLLSPVFSRSALIWKKTGPCRDKSVQLVRGSFLLMYFLQNPYFSSWVLSTLILFYKQHMIKKTSWTFLDFIQPLLSFRENRFCLSKKIKK